MKYDDNVRVEIKSIKLEMLSLQHKHQKRNMQSLLKTCSKQLNYFINEYVKGKLVLTDTASHIRSCAWTTTKVEYGAMKWG